MRDCSWYRPIACPISWRIVVAVQLNDPPIVWVPPTIPTEDSQPPPDWLALKLKLTRLVSLPVAGTHWRIPASCELDSATAAVMFAALTLVIVYGTRTTPFTTGQSPVGEARLGAMVAASGVEPL